MAASDFIDRQAVEYPEFAAQYTEFGELYRKKLWHQLTLKLVEFVKNPEADRGNNLIQLWDNFVSEFEARIDQLALVRIAVAVSAQYTPSRPYASAEVDNAIAFLSRFTFTAGDVVVEKEEDASMAAASATGAGSSAGAGEGETKKSDDKKEEGEEGAGAGEEEEEKVEDPAVVAAREMRKRLGEPAFLVALLGVAVLRLRGGDADTCKLKLADCKAILDRLDGVDAVVYSSYYGAFAEYHKARGPATDFYSNALRYLAYTPMESMTEEDRYVFAQDMALGALIGDGVYNFGEVVQHPILKELEGKPQAWLGELLHALHHGNIDGFNATVAAHREAYNEQPALVARDDLVKQKVSTLCLMEMASKREPGDRNISFEDIARETRLNADEIEWLLMQAMSLGLIKGSIDEVSQTVNITYVKPRVLDMAQVAVVQDKLNVWGDKTKDALLFLEEHTTDLLA